MVEVYRKLWDGLAADPISDETWDAHDRMVAMISHTVPTIDMWVASEKHILAWRGVIDRNGLRDPSSQPETGFFTYLRQCFERLRVYLNEGDS